MSKEGKLIRLLEIMQEARELTKEVNAIAVYHECYSNKISVQFGEDGFPLPKNLTTFTTHTEETDKHFVNISGIELFYLTDKEEEENAAV